MCWCRDCDGSFCHCTTRATPTNDASRTTLRASLKSQIRFGRLRLRCRAGPCPPAEGGKPAANHIEARREEQPERRDADHAGENRRPECLPELGAGARRPYQRRDTEDEGE